MRVRSASLVSALGLGLALATSACGGKATPAPSTPPPGGEAPAAAITVTDEELEAHLQAGLGFVTELGDRLAAVNGQECATIASTMEDVIARNTTVIETAARYQHDPAVKARTDVWAKAHEAELTAAAEKIGPAVAPCTDDPAVQAAAQKLSPP